MADDDKKKRKNSTTTNEPANRRRPGPVMPSDEALASLPDDGQAETFVQAIALFTIEGRTPEKAKAMAANHYPKSQRAWKLG